MKKSKEIPEEYQKLSLSKRKYPSKIDNWKMFEKSNPTIALNVLCIK